MAKFKKGDRVIVTKQHPYFNVGDIGVIDENAGHWAWCTVDGERWSIAEESAELYKEPNMNRLKGLKLKFMYGDNDELRDAILDRLRALGADDAYASARSRFSFVTIDDGEIDMWPASRWDGMDVAIYTEATLDDLYHLPKTHTITIDGNDIELSEGSYQALKAQFK